MVISLIEQDIRNTPNYDALARYVNLSWSRLSHLFKAETGLSLNQHLRTVRMKRAKSLLETTFLSVKETMLAVGFTDVSHFVREFKSIYNVTPSQYRKLYLNVNQLRENFYSQAQLGQRAALRVNEQFSSQPDKECVVESANA